MGEQDTLSLSSQQAKENVKDNLTEKVRLSSTACVRPRKKIMAALDAHCKLSMTTLVKVDSIKRRKKVCYHTKENSYSTTTVTPDNAQSRACTHRRSERASDSHW